MIKQLFLTIIIMVSIGFINFSQAQKVNGKDLVGTWLTADGTGHVHVYESGGKFYGKGTNADGSTEKSYDVNNEKKELRGRLLSDVLILKDFAYDGDGEWSDGEIYDPNNGKTYSCTITMINKNKIEVRGYVGISWFGRTESWTRVK